MMSKISSGCCSSSSSSSCCGPDQEKKQLVIDFLYLDLSVCERCQGAESNLDKAVDEVSVVLQAAGFEIKVNKVNITSKELAVKYKFLSSPTIRINGKDIILEIKESSCQECGDLCGDEVDCRVWIYEGIEYNEPPKELIINSILKNIYGGNKNASNEKEDYVLPDNLERFFDGLDQ